MISSIFSAIAAFPQLLKLVEQFIAWISKQVDSAKIKKAEDDAKKAADVAKTTKDTTDLDNLFDPGKKP